MATQIAGVATQIALVEDGPGSYRFTFASRRGDLSGRVTVGVEGPPDRRSREDREQAAKNQVLALSREFAEACEGEDDHGAKFADRARGAAGQA
jgi:hypothetical protein